MGQGSTEEARVVQSPEGGVAVNPGGGEGVQLGGGRGQPDGVANNPGNRGAGR